jgi:ketosteroid isomerase-like protein
MAARWLAPALAATLAAAAPARAQIPGDELPQLGRMRLEYLNTTFGDVKGLLADWSTRLARGDARRAAQLFTADGLFSPAEGWYAQGRAAVADTLAARLPILRGYHTSFLDFSASGNLAYYMGRFRYEHGPPAASRVVTGTFVMVLYLDGRNWRIRSYVERLGD